MAVGIVCKVPSTVSGVEQQGKGGREPKHRATKTRTKTQPSLGDANSETNRSL
jgi:hypothetical protein